MNAGELVIKTIIDNKNAKKQINDLKQQLKQEEKSLKEFLTYKIQLDAETGGLEEVEETLKNIQKAQKQGLKEVEIEGIGIVNLEQHKQDLLYTRDLYKQINNEIDDSTESIKKLNVALASEQIKENIKDVGKQIGKNIKSIGKMALAIFGIRSAYMMIRSAINDVGKSNKNVTDTLTYAKTMLSTALEPVVIRIVDWLKQALAYINALVKAWFKRDLFAETNKNLKKANKQASALKKTLTGFDEMNILNSPSTGGGGGISSSDLGLPNVQEAGIFGWILNNKDLILAAITGITTGLISMRLLGLSPLQGIFVALTTTGIVLTVENLLKAFSNPTWGTIPNIIGGIGLAIGGVAGALTSVLPAIGPAGWVITGIGLVVGVLGTLIGHLRDSKEATFDLEKAEQNLENSRLARQKAETQYIQSLKNHTDAVKKLEKAQKDQKVTLDEVLEEMQKNGGQYDLLPDKMKPVYEAYLDEQLAAGNLKTASENLTDARHDEAIETLNEVAANAKATNSYKELYETVNKMISENKITTEDAKKVLSDLFGTLSKDGKKTFKDELPKYFNASTKEVEKLKKELQNLYTAYDKMSRARGFSVHVTRTESSSTKGAKGLMLYPNKMPKLAVGGIVNQPGRGIPYGGAIIGERGAEAVVPLTDSQQMELLGATIGKYITIHNTNPIYMNGRLIAKEINRSNAEDDFAFNR